MIRRLLFTTIAAGLGTLSVLAGTTGKIAGIVKDKQTGEQVIGANIVVEGTSMGAATNIDGYYVILNIQPGKYTLVASAVGYNKVAVNNVNVSIDLTTTIDIELVSTVVEVGEEVVVTAERPLVVQDLTAKTAVVSSEEISALPVTEVGELVELQAGFVDGRLRGGRSGEVAYWIDGVPVTDVYNGDQVVEVNKDLVQELQVVSGAFNAEYGQAMSGIVNIATKEGGVDFAGGVSFYGGQYVTGDNTTFPGNSKFRPTAIHNYEGNLSGPILGEDLTFFATGRYIYFDGWLKGYRRFLPQNIAYTDVAGNYQLYRDPSGRGDSAVVPMNSSERWYGQGKVTWRISPLIKLSTNYIYDRTKSRPYDNVFNEDNRLYFYNPDGFGHDYNTSNTVIMQLSHTLNQSTFYTLGASWFEKRFKYYLYENQFDPRYVHPKVAITDDSFSFRTGGTDLDWNQRLTRTWLAKVDISSQLDQANLVKVGAEFRAHKVFLENITLQPVQEQSDINLATDSPYIRTRIPEISSSFHDRYEHKPYEISAYAQDKLEFKNFILNIGLRFDYFQPNGVVLADPSDPDIYNPVKPGNRFNDTNGNGIQDPGEASKTVEDRRAYWYLKATPKWQFSPRVGASFPITAQGVIYFSYGYFFQVPRFERLYQNPDFKLGFGTGNQGVVGNADLKPEQTINAEIGIQQQLTEDIKVDLTAYLRDIRNLTGTRGDEIIVFGGARKYSRFINSDFGLVKGIALTVSKRFGGGFAATLDYTFQIARGSASDPEQARNALAGNSEPEIQLTALNWDQRHTLNVTAAYSASNWGVSLISQYGTGTPYTPRRATDISSSITNSQIKPEFFNMDARAYYTIPVAPFNVVAFVRVFNIFDIRNETGVFDDTGRAGFTTDYERNLGNAKGRVNTLEQWYTRPAFYSEPRRIEFGLNLEF